MQPWMIIAAALLISLVWSSIHVHRQEQREKAWREGMKQRAEAAMAAGARGIKVQCAGRLGGADMKRTETTIMGSIPLQRLQANIDYNTAEAFCTFIDMAGSELSSADLITMTQNLEVKSESSWKRIVDDKGTDFFVNVCGICVPEK